MRKLVRATYPIEINIFIVIITFLLSCFFSHEMFLAHMHDPELEKSAYSGMFLIGVASVLMVLIVWEEILFPIQVKEVRGGLIFRNHRTKLVTQVLIYMIIPAIFIYIYLEYDVKLSHFIIWAIVCMVPPVAEKIISGINNYQDFLRLTLRSIEYKNNEKEGRYMTKDMQHIVIINDKREGLIIKKIVILFKNNEELTIDLDEMELEAFYGAIHDFITKRYKYLLKE